MKTAIMQPYFCPYIGYYQLINSVDMFVIYDNIQYNKKGWFNRNRILVNGEDRLFTIPLKKDSDYLHVNERYLASDSLKERVKILALIRNSYRNAPYFQDTYAFFDNLFLQPIDNLFHFILNSVKETCTLLGIQTPIVISSDLEIDHNLKAEYKVLEICKNVRSKTYINAIGGKVLYQKDFFGENNIDLKFIEPRKIEYKQFENDFIPWLSIIDVLMFNGTEKTKSFLTEYDLG